MEKLDGKNFDVIGDNISKLKEIFPEVVNGDNQIDFDNLRDILEKDIEVVDYTEEHYKFTWWGKKESKRKALESTTKTLRPSKKDSKNWNTTENIYIEGDNLDALKILLGSYRNKIKMIFIDPPYNTGNDFVYKDNRTETEKEHLESTGQLSEEGNLFENAKTDGKFHSNWLNMMYPRLYLARKLLADDGCIFVSIDFNEVENLKKIMDEIFGESNFQREIIWRIGWLSGYKTMAPNFIRNHDTILFYSKNHQKLDFIKKYVVNEDFKPLIKKEKNLNAKLNSLGLRKDQQNDLLYFINHENRPEKYPIEDTWNCNEYDDLNSIAIVSFSGEKISKILGIDQEFKGQKSVEMLKRILVSTTKNEDIVMDFFSGTSSTAHAVMKLNNEDGFNRKFIMVQIPELLDESSEAYKNGYDNICEIGKERIRRVGDKIVKDSNNNNLDIGFKVFKIDESNFIPWNPKLNTPEDVEQAIIKTANNIVQGSSEIDLIYELLLKLNLDLNVSIEEKQINNNKFYVVDNGFMIVCLDENLNESITKDIINLREELMTDYCKVILLDKALNSNFSINIFNELNSENIELYTI